MLNITISRILQGKKCLAFVITNLMNYTAYSYAVYMMQARVTAGRVVPTYTHLIQLSFDKIAMTKRNKR